MTAQLKSPDPAIARSVTEQGMKAQAALLPYALVTFGVCLPVFVWAASHAANAGWMGLSFVAFAACWAAFYAVAGWLRDAAANDLRRRARVQALSGLLWAATIAQLTTFAHFAGPARETLQALVLAAAVICVGFTTPWLPSLLIVAPAALASPLISMAISGDSEMSSLGLCASALALALALLVNRILRAQYALAAEREALIADGQAQAEAARRLARSKSDLVSTLSDEIHNGLTGVAHVLESAVGRGRVAPSRHQVTAALDAVNDLLAVLTTTVDSENAEAGRLTVRPRPLDLAALAETVVATHRPAAVAKGLELALHVDEAFAAAPGATVADPGRAQQVLAALIGNAVKFTMRGRVEIRISREAEHRVALAIADTGPGLSEDELSTALRPFQRIARTAAGSSGAGLGLPLAVQLARLMDGALRTESAPGVGSCFTLDLPFDPTATAAKDRPSPVSDVARRLRVLTVEADALGAAMLRATLEQLGHQVVHAADARRAVELARICDLDLLVAGDPAVIVALRELSGAAGDTPAIALTRGDPQEADAALAAGASALLRRPVAVPAAARAIAEALSATEAANDRAVA